MAAQVQTAQPGRASALYGADGVLPAGDVADAAPTRPDDAGFAGVVFRGPKFWLESAGLSPRHLVFQSILLAAAVYFRFMVRARRSREVAKHHQFADHIVLLPCVSLLRAGDDDGRQVSGVRGPVSALAL